MPDRPPSREAPQPSRHLRAVSVPDRRSWCNRRRAAFSTPCCICLWAFHPRLHRCPLRRSTSSVTRPVIERPSIQPRAPGSLRATNARDCASLTSRVSWKHEEPRRLAPIRRPSGPRSGADPPRREFRTENRESGTVCHEAGFGQDEFARLGMTNVEGRMSNERAAVTFLPVSTFCLPHSSLLSPGCYHLAFTPFDAAATGLPG